MSYEFVPGSPRKVNGIYIWREYKVFQDGILQAVIVERLVNNTAVNNVQVQQRYTWNKKCQQ